MNNNANIDELLIESVTENANKTPTQNTFSNPSDELSNIHRLLKELESEKAALKTQLASNTAKHEALSLRAIELEFSLRIGSIVRDRTGKLYLVTHITPSFTGKFDSVILTSLSQQYRRRGFLSSKQMAIVHKRLPKYWRQIIYDLNDQDLERVLSGHHEQIVSAN